MKAKPFLRHPEKTAWKSMTLKLVDIMNLNNEALMKINPENIKKYGASSTNQCRSRGKVPDLTLGST